MIRSGLDDGLRAEAVAAGARYWRASGGRLVPRVRDGTVVGIADGDGDVGASVVIDASGTHGWLRRALQLDDLTDSAPFWLHRGYARDVRARTGTQWQITRRGWLWIRATSTRHIWTSLTRVRDDDVRWPAGASPVGHVWGQCRRWRRLRLPAGAGYFVCGDAARFLDPATGDGLRFAIESGLRAGLLAVERIRDPRRSSVSAALYADWVARDYERNRIVLERSYASAGLDVGRQDAARRFRCADGPAGAPFPDSASERWGTRSGRSPI